MVGLDLRTATSILRGSHEGPVVVKQAPDESLLYRKVSRRMMPPPAFNLKLTDSEIDTVRRWIEAGAPSDEEATIAAKREEETARFEELALPIFEDRCFACHATDTPMGGLDLRTVQSVLMGSEGGPVISDLGSIKSILIRKLTSREMPPPGMGQPLERRRDPDPGPLDRRFGLPAPAAPRGAHHLQPGGSAAGDRGGPPILVLPEARGRTRPAGEKTEAGSHADRRLHVETARIRGTRFLSRCLQAHVAAARLAGPDRSSAFSERHPGSLGGQETRCL